MRNRQKGKKTSLLASEPDFALEQPGGDSAVYVEHNSGILAGPDTRALKIRLNGSCNGFKLVNEKPSNYNYSESHCYGMFQASYYGPNTQCIQNQINAVECNYSLTLLSWILVATVGVGAFAFLSFYCCKRENADKNKEQKQSEQTESDESDDGLELEEQSASQKRGWFARLFCCREKPELKMKSFAERLNQEGVVELESLSTPFLRLDS